ncbi:hypothetical protein ABZ070_11430 [Streptomyces sp. NPDC006283]|uniref:hypothetical protein n=1 Tax=Streptomyces sp. NPDC006283 TaxID=3156741 RepID=UPI0033A84205
MHTIRTGLAAGLMGLAALGLSAPATTAAESVTVAPTTVCGTDSASGLTVSADRAETCATALQVAGAYTQVWHSTGGAATTVHAQGATWSCQELQGDPNPYQACVNTRDSGQRVTLTS